MCNLQDQSRYFSSLLEDFIALREDYIIKSFRDYLHAEVITIKHCPAHQIQKMDSVNRQATLQLLASHLNRKYDLRIHTVSGFH